MSSSLVMRATGSARFQRAAFGIMPNAFFEMRAIIQGGAASVPEGFRHDAAKYRLKAGAPVRRKAWQRQGVL